MAFSRYESYRDSGVEWIGEIPSSWDLLPIRAIFHERQEKNIGPKTDFILSVMKDRGVIPYDEKGNVGNKKSENIQNYKVVYPGDLVINKMNAIIGSLGISDYHGALSQVYIILYPKDHARNDHRYLGYLFKVKPFQTSLIKIGKGIMELRESIEFNEFKKLPLPLPSIEEQDRIANFLDQKTTEIDESIAKKQRLIELLKEQKSIMISHAVTKGLNPNAPMRDSGVEWLGEVPSHWKVKKNRELFVERKESGSELLPILTVSLHTGVSDTEQDETENIRSKIRIEDKTSYRRVYPGDIAFNMMRAWQGAIGVVKADGQVSPAYIIANPCGQIEGEYFEYQYRTSSFIGQMDRYSKGITDFRKRLYWAEFKTLNTIVPPIEEQKEIVKIISEIALCIDKTVGIIAQEIERIKEFRSVMISDAVTGKIKI